MKKETIEHWRNKGSIKGYGYLVQPKQLSQESILDALCKWSKNKKATIYSHAIRRVEENIGPKIYKYFRYGGEISKKTYEAMIKEDKDSAYFVPYCDDVYYLDIYYQ